MKRIKPVILSLMCITPTLYSCSDDEIMSDYSSRNETIQITYIEDGKIVDAPARGEYSNAKAAISFPSQKSYEEFTQAFESMDEDTRTSVVNKMGVNSYSSLFEIADNELERLGEKALSETQFKAMYDAYVKKYEGRLIVNSLDPTDLTLYLPDDENWETYIANEDGYYVVDGEVRCVNTSHLPESLEMLSRADESNKGQTTFLNHYLVYPVSGKQLKFAIGRKYDTVKIAMHFKKKMWYGWKNDPHRHYIFEFLLGNLNRCVPQPRLWSNCKKGIDMIVGFAIKPRDYVDGMVFTWTDYSFERDANGEAILENCRGWLTPKCKYEKSIPVQVLLAPHQY